MSVLKYPQDIKEKPTHEEVQSCNLCPYSTESIFLMKNHVKFHLPIATFSCEKSAPERYKCEHCDFHTDLFVILKKHIQQFHLTSEDEGESQIFEYTLQSFNCRSCTFGTYSLLHWLQHLKIGCSSTEERKDIDLFYCGKCSFKTKYKRNIQRHNIRKHLASEEFQCDKCSHEPTARVTCPHIALTLSDLFHCNKCSFKTISIAGLRSHNLRKHSQFASEEIQWFQCDKCSYKTNKKSNLKTHNIRHHLGSEEIEWLQCDKCPYKTKIRGTLTTHISRLHTELTNSDLFHCDKCSFKTKNRTNLKRHNIRVHLASEEIEWFQCDKCPHKSKLQIDLTSHITRKHTELKIRTDLFHCDKCTFKTKYKRNLRMHSIRLHLATEDIQWVQCGKCPYKAKTVGNLWFHKVKKHHK